MLGFSESDNLDVIYDPNDFRGYRKDEVMFVYVEELSDLTETTTKAKISFKNKNQETEVFFTVGGVDITSQQVYDRSAVYAAFISGNQEVFQCMLEKAFFKARDVVPIYEQRILSLDDGSFCSTYYTTALTEIGTMRVNLNEPGTGAVLVNRLRSNIVQFDLLNNLLERASCPLLY